MIIIYNGSRQIYHPQNPNLKLVNPKLTLEDSAAGSLSFKIYDSNLNYSTIKKLYPVISVVRNDKTIFKGRVISDKKDFYNGKSVEVEGKLAFFNDSYLDPFSFSGSPAELFKMIIENHNSKVMDWQQFKVGIVTVTDPNDYIVRSSENVLNSWDALKDKCFKSSLGGHIRVRYEADGDYIDWLADYDAVSGQSIEFAKNMIDLSSEVDATETYTAIRPIGAEVEGVKIDIASVNDGKNYIVNEEKAADYGIIYAPDSEATWEDVTLPENLLKKAKERLFGSFITLKETYEIKAVDLNLTNEDIEALDICEYVPVISRPHGINGNYLLSKADISIAEPQNSVFYLGSSRRTLSDMNSGGTTIVTVPKSISSFENDAGYISEEQTKEMLSDYSKAEEVLNIVDQAVSQIPSGEPGKDGAAGASAYETAVSYGFTGTEEEWLASLKGEPGKDGADGLDGTTPNIGENGNWIIDGTDTGKPSRGENGLAGQAATISVGTVTTGEPGIQASVTNSGTSNAAVLDFVIPRGEKGKDGNSGGTLTAEEIERIKQEIRSGLDSKIGALEELKTEVKDNLVAAINEVSGGLTKLGGFEPVMDETGKITGYRTEAGADTVFPFNTGSGGSADYSKAFLDIIGTSVNAAAMLGTDMQVLTIEVTEG